MRAHVIQLGKRFQPCVRCSKHVCYVAAVVRQMHVGRRRRDETVPRAARCRARRPRGSRADRANRHAAKLEWLDAHSVPTSTTTRRSSTLSGELSYMRSLDRPSQACLVRCRARKQGHLSNDSLHVPSICARPTGVSRMVMVCCSPAASAFRNPLSTTRAGTAPSLSVASGSAACAGRLWQSSSTNASL